MNTEYNPIEKMTFKTIIQHNGDTIAVPELGSLMTTKLPAPKWYQLIKWLRYIRNNKKSWLIDDVIMVSDNVTGKTFLTISAIHYPSLGQ